METRSQDLTRDDDAEIDPRTERWVTVAEAASMAGVSGAAIRGWYRSGLVPTQRADGDRGAFLVPLSEILRLGAAADDAGDDLGDSVVDLNASYWSIETAVAREETEAIRGELAEVRAQLDFVRSQLAEASAGERAAVRRADEAETALAALRKIAAATSSIVDSSWLELPTNVYSSPVRGQGHHAAHVLPLVAAPEDDLDDDDVVIDLDEGIVIDLDDEAAGVEKVEHPRPGDHADDLLPLVERRGRRSRR